MKFGAALFCFSQGIKYPVCFQIITNMGMFVYLPVKLSL